MPLQRSFNRSPASLRPLEIQPNYYPYGFGSCLVKFGNTHVLCAANVEDSVPPHLKGKGQGWVTGEYNMLPGSSPERVRRERNNVGGRTHEIQRLIGRALRSVISTQGWGERTITIDCDVLRADGGTRTASITGAYVCLVLAIRKLWEAGKVSKGTEFPIRDWLSACSVGVVGGTAVLDLDYKEDSTAETDMNLVMTGKGDIVEIQGTAEKNPFSQQLLLEMLELGRNGCMELIGAQQKILGDLHWVK